jgi:hypothetical protein
VPATGRIVGVHAVGVRPQWGAFDGPGPWVTNGTDNTVSHKWPEAYPPGAVPPPGALPASSMPDGNPPTSRVKVPCPAASIVMGERLSLP